MSIEENISVTREDFIRGFSNLSLRRGHKVIVHGSLSSFGFVEGGTRTVVQALMDAIASEGLLVMPAFTYGRDVYDPACSVSHTGRIAEEFRKMPGVRRSLHPTHSLCAWGKDAGTFVEGHDRMDPFGPNSPLHRFIYEGGYVLLLGVTHTSNCVIHVAQELAPVPYLDRPKHVRLIDQRGEIQTVTARRAGCSLGFDKITPFLEEKKLEKLTAIGNAAVRAISAKEIVDVAVRLFKETPSALLCDRGDCFACNEARTMIQQSNNA